MKALLVLLSFYVTLISDSPDSEPSFEIEVLRKSEMVIMKCTKGCNWKNLEFSLKNESVIVSQSGLKRTNNTSSIPESSFAFHVEPAKNGLTFKSIRGTNWKEISYGRRPRRTMFLDASGISSERK